MPQQDFDGLKQGFAAWALDPARTLEESYVAECLVGPGLGYWRHKNKIQVPWDWDAIRAARKHRKLNPAYRPILDQQDVERAAEGLSSVHHLTLGDHEDRPVRVLTGIEFAPNAHSVFIHSEGVRDWYRLGALQQMTHLSVHDDETDDFGGLGACRQLPKLIVYSRRPWPKLAGWEGMVQLRELDWNGNLFVFEDVPRLENMRAMKLSHSYHANLPLRDATRLPEMPKLQSLVIDPIHRLDGLERYSSLCNLTVTGPIRDLAPLAKLTRLTHLSLTSNELNDLTPLTALPELRFLRIIGEKPLDWFVLSDMSRLHEIEVNGCEHNTEEAGTLQEVLKSWDEDFRAATPRPLAPLRVIVNHDVRVISDHDKFDAEGPAGWDGNRMMRDSEHRWHSRRFKAALQRLLGDVKWGHVGKPIAWGHDFHVDIHLTTFAGAMRLPEVVETVRSLLAESRFRRMIHICVQTDPLDDYDPDEEIDEETQAERDRQDEEYWEKQRQERAAFLERQHKLRLRQQESGKIQPDEFAAKEEPPPPPPEPVEQDGPPLLDQSYFIYGWITETGLYVTKNGEEDAEKVMGQPLEDPGPPPE